MREEQNHHIQHPSKHVVKGTSNPYFLSMDDNSIKCKHVLQTKHIMNELSSDNVIRSFASSFAEDIEAQAFAEDVTRSWEDIEAKELSGQKLQGPSTCIDDPRPRAGHNVRY